MGDWVGGKRAPLAGASCQELKKLQEEKCRSERTPQPSQESRQVAWPSLAPSQPGPAPPQSLQRKRVPEQPPLQPQPPPSPPQPPPLPGRQDAQDPLTGYTLKHNLQDCKHPGPQLDSAGIHQAGGRSNYFNNRVQGGSKFPQDLSK